MKTFLRHRGSQRGGGLPWIVALVALGSGAAFFLMTKKPEAPVAAPPTMAARTPAPISPITPLSPAAAPEAPVVPEPAPEAPPPIVQATPTPAPAATPPPLDLATVARTPALWPLQVGLVQALSFPVVLNGRVVGQAQAKPGTLLRLLRISGEQIEIEFQNARHVIPAASTDLMQRALAKFTSGGAALAVRSRPASAASLPAMSAPARPASAPAATPRPAGDANVSKLAKSIAVETIPKKGTKIEGGDFDDKKDRFTLRVKFTNTDNALAMDNLKAEIYIFAESILDRNVRKVLAVEDFTFSLPVHGTHEVATKEASTMYDKTGARFGYEYEGWLLRVRASDGALVLVKSSIPSVLKMADKVTGLKVNGYYERNTFKETKSAGR